MNAAKDAIAERAILRPGKSAEEVPSVTSWFAQHSEYLIPNCFRITIPQKETTPRYWVKIGRVPKRPMNSRRSFHDAPWVPRLTFVWGDFYTSRLAWMKI